MICNLGVVGSNPTRGSKRIEDLSFQSFFVRYFIGVSKEEKGVLCLCASVLNVKRVCGACEYLMSVAWVIIKEKAGRKRECFLPACYLK